MSLSDKIRAIVHELLRRIGLRILSSCIAPDFSESTPYKVGQLVKYGDGLYRCLKDYGPGEWPENDPQYFGPVSIADVVFAMGIDNKFPPELNIKELGDNNYYHKVVVRKSGNTYTIAVDQEQKSRPS